MNTPVSDNRPLEATDDVRDLHPKIDSIIRSIKHYLPAQAPLKDFVHHNPLHAFQHLHFDEARVHAATVFGYRTSLSLREFRMLHRQGQISEGALNNVLTKEKGDREVGKWREKLLHTEYPAFTPARLGSIRAGWKKHFRIDLDSMVHPTLFRVLCSYLDQGISIWTFPGHEKGFLAALVELERNSLSSLFRTRIAREWMLAGNLSPFELLRIIIGENTSLYEHYLFDQQFAHQGWSGMVSAIEDNPRGLMDRRKISLRELIVFELLLEMDALHSLFGAEIRPLGDFVPAAPPLFDPVERTELHDVIALWQKAYEWTYFDQILAAIKATKVEGESASGKSFQALCCIDDRSSSFRRYLELTDERCETFGTPGHFNVAFWFKSEGAKAFTKLCPAPVFPEVLVREIGGSNRHRRDIHFTKRSHTLFTGWIISQTVGFWSAFKLMLNLLRPSESPAAASSFALMDEHASITVKNTSGNTEKNLRIGFTLQERVDHVEGLLRSIGLVKDFSRLVYVIGHGASSVNNPHYAAYDCGACSGRPGSVNARVFCQMANDPEVRTALGARGIDIPSDTHFVSALHDTTRDEIFFYDQNVIPAENRLLHQQNIGTFDKALALNAKERSRRFAPVNTRRPAAKIHPEVKDRSVSLFEPRPEYNHATNAICVIGRRSLTKELFLDRRAFLNSYDYRIDPDGKYLEQILRAAAPVCGGINLEYFFSRVDVQKLGAGSKLPHNVMGLFGVANGIEGDLRPGLPRQMIEIHDPVRLLTIVEHKPEIVLRAAQQHAATYTWYQNEWSPLVAIHPETREFYLFQNDQFHPYQVFSDVKRTSDVDRLVESSEENIPVHLIVAP